MELASSIGPVSFTRIFRDRETGRSRGSGKIAPWRGRFMTFPRRFAWRKGALIKAKGGSEEFESEEHASKAVELKEFQGRAISVRPFVAEVAPQVDGRQVFVAGLAPGTTAETLRAFCVMTVGPVDTARVFLNRDTKESKGTGKVEFETPLLARKAVEDELYEIGGPQKAYKKAYKSLMVMMIQGPHLAVQELSGRLLDGHRLTARLMEQEKPRQRPDGRTVFLGGLSWELDSDGLRSFAEQVGPVTHAAVFTNRETGKSRGSGKVQYESQELARKAVEELNGRELLGREARNRSLFLVFLETLGHLEPPNLVRLMCFGPFLAAICLENAWSPRHVLAARRETPRRLTYLRPWHAS